MSVVSDSVWPQRQQPTRLPCLWDSPGKNLEWVAISFSNAWKWKVKVKSLSHVWLLATPWTAAYQAPVSMGFSRQEYWSGLPLPSPMHESGKWKWSRSVVYDPQRPHGLQPYQAPPSMGFSRQEYWSGLPLPSPKSQLILIYKKGILTKILTCQSGYKG